MRATKVAIAAAIAADKAVTALIPAAQIYAVERSTIPTLPSIEVIGISTEREGSGPMVRHSMSVEVTVSHAAEDDADSLLDGLVRAVRQRLDAAGRQTPPIALAGGEGVSIELRETRWSISASASAGVIRGAAVAVAAVVSE